MPQTKYQEVAVKHTRRIIQEWKSEGPTVAQGTTFNIL